LAAIRGGARSAKQIKSAVITGKLLSPLKNTPLAPFFAADVKLNVRHMGCTGVIKSSALLELEHPLVSFKGLKSMIEPFPQFVVIAKNIDAALDHVKLILAPCTASVHCPGSHDRI
jgi:hypothetical protein